MTRLTALTSAAVLLLLPALHAQSPSAPLMEVASVKLHPPDDNTQWMINPQPGGRLRLRGTPERLIAIANRLQMDQVVAAPSWAKSDTYDIMVKVRDGVAINIDTVAAIVREVIADRFQLQTHADSRELPVYLLTAARADRSPGPHLSRASFDCTLRNGPPPPLAAGQAPPPDAGRCGLNTAPGEIHMGGFPLNPLIVALSQVVGRVVVDRTGLEGIWNLDVEYAAEQPAAPGAPPLATDRPSLFTALQEQLGLKLEAGRAPVPVLVIDRLSRPSED